MANKLTHDEVRHIAKLSDLKLSDDEIVKFADQLSGVIEYISVLSEVDTSDVMPTSQTTGLENVTHDDTSDSTVGLSQSDATSGTENINNGYFVVPLTLTERTI